ncbi:MAG: hypothetical protein JWM53_567 [bacterium]|nr:hypothetical protein [bacterium]
MRKMMLALGAAATLAMGASGCAHEMHQAASDAHHRQAKRDAKDLRLGDAVHEEHESNVEQRKADRSRF